MLSAWKKWYSKTEPKVGGRWIYHQMFLSKIYLSSCTITENEKIVLHANCRKKTSNLHLEFIFLIYKEIIKEIQSGGFIGGKTTFNSAWSDLSFWAYQGSNPVKFLEKKNSFATPNSPVMIISTMKVAWPVFRMMTQQIKFWTEKKSFWKILAIDSTMQLKECTLF